MNRRIVWFFAAFLFLCGGMVLLPRIDLWASGLFYRPGEGFFLGSWPPFWAIHKDLPYAVTAFVLFLLAALLVSLLRQRPVLGLDSKAAFFLLLSLAIGPGLIVNTIFKDHWGRARPAQIVQFGGHKTFSPAFVPSDQCFTNCSFPAGDPSVGFYLVSAAFLVPIPRRRRWATAGAIALGSAIGVVRIAQGGHFLSDVVASGFIIYGLSWLLHRALIAYDGLGALRAAFLHPSPALKRAAWLTLATILLFAFSYAFVDKPLAVYLYNRNATLLRVFMFITQFGLGGTYLVPLAIVIAWALWSRRKVLASRAGFVFGAIALPGLFTDIMKPVFGRARPELLFRDHLFGFTWIGPHADRWSFPSGHTVTIVALATALYAIYPPLWPVYAFVALLITASRVIVDAHYLSDVIAGAYVGFIGAWALAETLKRRGIPLELPRRKAQ